MDYNGIQYFRNSTEGLEFHTTSGGPVITYFLPFIAINGIWTNSSVIIIAVKPGLMTGLGRYYMASLGVADLIISILGVVMWMEMVGAPIVSTWSCKLSHFLFYSSLHANAMILVVMSVDRYHALRRPLVHTSPTCVIGAVIITTFLCAAFNSHFLWTITSKYSSEEDISYCTISHPSYEHFLMVIYPVLDAVVYSLLPILIVTPVNILIARLLRKSSKLHDTLQSERGRTDKRRLTVTVRNHREITRMLLLMTTSFLIFTLPIATYLIVSSTVDFDQLPEDQQAAIKIFHNISISLSFTHHAMSFVLYAIGSHRFRVAIHRLANCEYPRRKQSSTGKEHVQRMMQLMMRKGRKRSSRNSIGILNESRCDSEQAMSVGYVGKAICPTDACNGTKMSPIITQCKKTNSDVCGEVKTPIITVTDVDTGELIINPGNLSVQTKESWDLKDTSLDNITTDMDFNTHM